MARKERNDVDYFPYYCKEGKAMYYIESTYGNDGYAVWMKILRQLAVSNYHFLDLHNKVDFMFLCSKCKVSKELLEAIINDLCDLGEIDKELWDDRVIWSEKFTDSVSDAYRKRNTEPIYKNELIRRLLDNGRKLCSNGRNKPTNPTEKGGRSTQTILYYTKEKKTKEDLFDWFWSLYPKKTGKKKARELFFKLEEFELCKIVDTLQDFINHKPFDNYNHPDPERYLKNERWDDEIVKKSSNYGHKF